MKVEYNSDGSLKRFWDEAIDSNIPAVNTKNLTDVELADLDQNFRKRKISVITGEIYNSGTHAVDNAGMVYTLPVCAEKYRTTESSGRIVEMTQAEKGAVDAAALPNVKTMAVSRINSEAQAKILDKYPMWVQSNCANGIYPSAYSTQMKADIAAVITAANTATDEIMAASDETGVNSVIVIWPVI